MPDIVDRPACPKTWQLSMVAQAAAGYNIDAPRWFVAPADELSQVLGPYETEGQAAAASATHPGSVVVGPVCAPDGAASMEARFGTSPGRVVVYNANDVPIVSYRLDQVDVLTLGWPAYNKFVAPYYASHFGLDVAVRWRNEANSPNARTTDTGDPIVAHRINSGQLL
jgi:hypothetical protein